MVIVTIEEMVHPNDEKMCYKLLKSFCDTGVKTNWEENALHAAKVGNLCAFMWITQKFPEIDFKDIKHYAFENGFKDVFDWLEENTATVCDIFTEVAIAILKIKDIKKLTN
jgi:hypothetical protein